MLLVNVSYKVVHSVLPRYSLEKCTSLFNFYKYLPITRDLNLDNKALTNLLNLVYLWFGFCLW